MVLEILASLATNPYFSAGFGLVGVGTGLAALRATAKIAYHEVKRVSLVTLEVPSKDKSFGWLMDFLGDHRGLLSNQHLSVETTYHQHENGEISARVNFVPSPGDHFLFYKKKLIKLQRVREKNVVDLSSGSLWETLTLTMIGRQKDKQILYDLIEEAKKKALAKEEGKTVIYTVLGGDWRRFGLPRRKRPLGSVVLDRDISHHLLADVKEFLASSNWYRDRGIPYRRGYLLHGPPGCGKSSFVSALAGELKLNICILNLNSKELNDEVLNHLMNFAPQRSIILLEDIDAAFNQRESHSHRITFSGLLNALDGVASQEGRILFMTTNHLEKLDPALIRPGRVDVQKKLDFASKTQIKNLFQTFYPLEAAEMEQKVVEEFVEKIPEYVFSVAQIQGYFLTHKAPQEALSHLHQLLGQIHHKEPV